ncbi:phage portal protein [Nocardiopsis terrae]|uniref:phage portal protein n=1 Tax=Streptomyces sp. NPDC057554 TaxID=3350538 RepID=UPI0036AF982B
MPASGDLQYGVNQLDQEKVGYDEAQVFYEGKPQEVFSSAEVKRLLRKSMLHQLKNLNFARIPVDEVVSRLRVVGATVTDDNGDPYPDAQAELDRVMSENRLDTELNRLWHNVSQYSDGYLFVWPRQDGEHITGVDVLVQNPRTCTVVYSEERQLEADFQLKLWCSDRTPSKEVHQSRVYYPDGRIEYYETKPGKSCDQKRSWAHVDTLSSDYGLPLFHFSVPWPEHYWAYTAQLIINKLVITQVATVERLGFPQRYGLLNPKRDDVREREFEGDGLDDDDETDLPPQRLRNEPGAFHELEYDSVGEFSAANPSAFLTPMDWYVRAISQLTGTPMDLIDPQLRGQVSGESLKVSKEPLTNKVRDRHQHYTGTLKDALEHALWLLGFEDAHVSITWESVEPAVAEEDPADVEINRAIRVISSLNDLASASAVGAISPQTAQEIVDQLLVLVHGTTGTKKGTTV